VVDLHRLRLVDQVEQGRKRVAQADAAAAAVADVEHPLHFGVQCLLIHEFRIEPVQRVPGRRLQVAFALFVDQVHDQPPGGRGQSAFSPGRKGTLTPIRGSRQPRSPSALVKRFACERSALARVSNQSAISSKPSSRAAFTMPGYMSVYSWVSPAMADLRLLAVSPNGKPVAGSPTASRYSR